MSIPKNSTIIFGTVIALVSVKARAVAGKASPPLGLAGKILTSPPYRGIIITRKKSSELKFGVPKVPKIWISVNQEIRVKDIR